MIKTRQHLVHLMTKAEGSAWVEERGQEWWLYGTGYGCYRVSSAAVTTAIQSGDLKNFGFTYRLKCFELYENRPGSDVAMWFDEATELSPEAIEFLCR